MKYLHYICIMKPLAFRYDYVRLSPDRQIGYHYHSLWELVYIVVGRGMRTIGRRTEPFAEGEVLLIPPDIQHVWHFDREVTASDGTIANIAVFFEHDLLKKLSIVLPEMADALTAIKGNTLALKFTGETRDKIIALLLSMREISPEGRVPKMLELLSLLSGTATALEGSQFKKLTRAEKRMEEIRVFCSCNYARKVTSADAAAHVGMNTSAFCIFLKRTSGRTFSDYLNGVRLEEAYERLRNTDEQIASIAYSVGFSSVGYFDRLFRLKYGITPKSIRNGH